jgi:small nuclear ribonucleoprotein (snRNP)-like protein
MVDVCIENVLPSWVHAVTGVLKGYDQLLNLVLDDAVEYMRGEGQAGSLTA